MGVIHLDERAKNFCVSESKLRSGERPPGDCPVGITGTSGEVCNSLETLSGRALCQQKV